MTHDRFSPRSRSALFTAALAFSILAAGCATTPAGGRPSLPAQVEAARTPEQHAVLAQEYELRAAQARAKADEHKALLDAYERGPHQYPLIGPVGPASGMPAMPRLCKLLIQNSEDEARIYTELAQIHRQWAVKPAPASRPPGS